MAMGAEQETLDSLLNSSIGIWAKYGDSISLDGLGEAVLHTSALGRVQGNLADALEWAGISVDDFNASLEQCTSEQGRQELIAHTLDRLYGDLSASYQESNASVIEANQANADYTQTMADMGAKIEPVTTTLKGGFTDLLQEVLKLTEDVDMEAFTSKIEEAFGVLKDEVLPAIKDGLQWILDNKDAIIAGLAGIATGFMAFNVASMIMGVVEAFKAFKLANEGATVAQWLLNTAMNANPIMLIVTLIATIVGALITFIATNEDARAKIGEVWDAIKEKISGFVESIKTFFTETIPEFFRSFIDWIKANWQSLLLIFINPFAGLFKYFYDNNGKFKEFVDNAIKFIKELPVKIWTWLLNTIAKVAQFKHDLGVKAKEAGQELLDKLIEKAQELPEKIKTVGVDVITGLWNGINDKISWLKEKISGFVGNVTDWLKEFFKIGSPSKLMANEVGKWLPEGIAVGITKNAKSTLNAMKDLAVDTVGSARAGLSTGTAVGGVVNNFTQVINSPKQLSRLDIYRQSKNLISYAGGGF